MKCICSQQDKIKPHFFSEICGGGFFILYLSVGIVLESQQECQDMLLTSVPAAAAPTQHKQTCTKNITHTFGRGTGRKWLQRLTSKLRHSDILKVLMLVSELQVKASWKNLSRTGGREKAPTFSLNLCMRLFLSGPVTISWGCQLNERQDYLLLHNAAWRKWELD